MSNLPFHGDGLFTTVESRLGIYGYYDIEIVSPKRSVEQISPYHGLNSPLTPVKLPLFAGERLEEESETPYMYCV